MLHQFSQPIAHIALPEKFTYPFHYTPHPLCMIAANELQDYIATREEWKEELQQGKMFGVLIVQTSTGELGYVRQSGRQESASVFCSAGVRPVTAERFL